MVNITNDSLYCCDNVYTYRLTDTYNSVIRCKIIPLMWQH